jgi:plasmid maintenance system antidote protein VapI
MTPAELEAWQGRVFGTGYGVQVKAAAALGVPKQTYRNWLAGRRDLPEPMALLARYVERFGPLDN